MNLFEQRFFYPIQIPFEDVDMGGVLYHPNYLNYFERARSQLLKSRGLTFKSLLEDKIAFVVSEIHSVYKKPCYLDEEYLILTQITGLRRSSMRVVQYMFKGATVSELEALTVEELAAHEKLHHITKMRLVTVDLTSNRPIEFPDNLKATLGFPTTGIPAPFNKV